MYLCILQCLDHSLSLFIVASQLWCLARLLPVMIGDIVDETDLHWENCLLMLTITDYVFGPVVSDDIATYIKVLIEDHHEKFKQLYPTAPIIPKMHFMLHLPEWMVRSVM